VLKPGLYPVTSKLAGKMIARIQGRPKKILEPSAGKGDLIAYLQARYKGMYSACPEISAIEIDEELQAMLRGKDIKVIDSDFLEFAGPDKFDLIIANPPFDEGDKHLLKAIQIIYCGEIIFLLNAETIRNPYSNIRKELVRKLDDLGADIEYIEGAFKDAERPTGVEVALVYIRIERQVEEDLFAGIEDHAAPVNPEIEPNYELSAGRAIEDLVAEYNQVVQIGQDTIVNYYRNYPKIGKYIGLNKEAKDYAFDEHDEGLTRKMTTQVNDLLKAVRTSFWRRTLELPDITRRLTSKKREAFEHEVTRRCEMDFTARNIRQFVLNLIGGFEKTLTDAVLEVFEKFTKKYCYSEGLYDENIHYFNGWKTNKAFKVGRRVIIPIYGSYGSAFNDSFDGRWKLNHGAAEQLRDIDLVMNYFDGMEKNFISMTKAIETAFALGQSSRIKSAYFTVNCYKKGTIHLTFNNEDILRRFNVVACKGREWLPHDYGTKAYGEMSQEERDVADAFEGEESYIKNLNQPLFTSRPIMPQLTAC
jgi:hypothetical protein